MADDKKKPAPAPAGLPAPFHKEHHKDTMLFLLVLLLLGYIITQVSYTLRGTNVSFLSGAWEVIRFWFERIWSIWKGIALVISLVCAGIAFHARRQIKKIEADEENIYGTVPKARQELMKFLFGVPVPSYAGVSAVTEEAKDNVNQKWQHVLELMNSTNSSDWRLSIIEADVMLDEALRAQQYHGDTVGDMLKSVEPSDMLTLDAAWEAHKVRNRIAHSGADFEINEREVKRVIRLFESVFKEFQII